MPFPPGPSTPTVLTTLKWLRSPYGVLEDCARRYGETFTLRIGAFSRFVVFSNPEHVREIFADDGDGFEAGRVNRLLAPMLGELSVLMADGSAHRRKRKLLLPPFHGERMQAYGRVMLDVSDATIDAFPEGKPFALYGPMQDITLRVIVRTVFGFDDGPRLEEMIRRMKRSLELGSWAPLLLPFMQVDLGRLTPYGRFRAAARESDAMLYDEIRRRRRDGTRGTDVLSLLLDARDEDGQPMSELELRDELVTLLVAGHETTATGLTWAVRWLIDSPHVLEELRAQLDALGPDPKPEQIAKCELLDGAAREALRLVPVIPFAGRALSRATTLGGWDLPAGTVVGCSTYLAHRRPAAFKDPEVYEPKRFVGKKVAPQEFFPFGGGVRRCIGMAFALYEMKMVLARVLTRLDLRLAEPGPVPMRRRSVTIAPARGLRLVARRRRAPAYAAASA